MENHILLNISEFTATQRERYNSIVPILGKAAIKVISNLKGRGRNSWKSILANIQLVNNSASNESEYYSWLDQEIDLEESYYTREQMTQIVSRTRFKMGWAPFEKAIERQCEQEMFKLFLWEDVTNPSELGGKPVLLGYKPLCRLKA